MDGRAQFGADKKVEIDYTLGSRRCVSDSRIGEPRCFDLGVFQCQQSSMSERFDCCFWFHSGDVSVYFQIYIYIYIYIYDFANGRMDVDPSKCGWEHRLLAHLRQQLLDLYTYQQEISTSLLTERRRLLSCAIGDKVFAMTKHLRTCSWMAKKTRREHTQQN